MLGTWMCLEGLDLFLLQGLGTQMRSLSSHHWAVGLLPALVGVKTSARRTDWIRWRSFSYCMKSKIK